MKWCLLGCDTGFGLELAQHLHQLGCKVYAGCLFKDGDGGKKLAEMGIDVLQLDVTKEEEWDLAVDHIQQNSKQLWGLVNNAGMHDTLKNKFWVLTLQIFTPQFWQASKYCQDYD